MKLISKITGLLLLLGLFIPMFSHAQPPPPPPSPVDGGLLWLAAAGIGLGARHMYKSRK